MDRRAESPTRDERRDIYGPERPTGALALLVAGAGAYLLSLLLAGAPQLVETGYVPSVTGTVAPALSRLVGVVPVALAEVLLALYAGRRLWTAARGVAALRAGRRSRGRVLVRGGWLLARDVGVLLLLFYLLWGFNYARAPLDERIGLPLVDSTAAPGVLDRLAEESVDEANRRYRELHGGPDAGRPTRMPPSLDALTPALRRGWASTTRALGLGTETVQRFAPPKPALTSPILARLGLVGFYVPYTAEAVVNVRTPAVAQAATVAHEQAHQRGVTEEGAATFLGHLVAGRSGDPLLRYSAAVRAQTRLLAALSRSDPDRADELRARRLPGVRRDLEDLADYLRRHRGPARRVASRVNDAYLRANQVPGGAESYDRVTGLLLRYGALEGRLYPAAEPADPVDEGNPRPGGG